MSALQLAQLPASTHSSHKLATAARFTKLDFSTKRRGDSVEMSEAVDEPETKNGAEQTVAGDAAPVAEVVTTDAADDDAADDTGATAVDGDAVDDDNAAAVVDATEDGGGGGGGDGGGDVGGDIDTAVAGTTPADDDVAPAQNDTGEPDAVAATEEGQDATAAAADAAVVVDDTVTGGNDDNDDAGGDDSVNVELLIVPENYKHMQSFSAASTLGDVKEELAARFQLDPSIIKLSHGDEALADDVYLSTQTLPDDARHAHLTMSIEYDMGGIDGGGGGGGGDDVAYEGEYTMPASIQTSSNIEVEVVRENLLRAKPFLGGVRHAYTQREYHHASAQTIRRARDDGVLKFDREAQTVEVATRSQQTNREAATQMARTDLVISAERDRVLYSKPYFPADELEIMREEAAVGIQCFLRQCFAWRKLRRLEEVGELEANAKAASDERVTDAAAREHDANMRRRMEPRSKRDFEVLHTELQQWREHETKRIKEEAMPPDLEHAALQALLDKEVRLIQTIDRLRIAARQQNRVDG
jgi:hypothetical protein